MLKTPNTGDKIRLMKNFKHEEEAFEEQLIKYEKNSCGRRCKVLLFYGVLIVMLVILYNFILLGWQSYMKQYGSNETSPVFGFYGIPLLHIDEKLEIIENKNMHENVHKRKRRSPHTVIGIQSDNANIKEKEVNHLEEESILDDTVSYKDNLHEDSHDLVKILEQIFASEIMGSKTEQNSYESNQGVEQVIDHQHSEDEDKNFIHYNNINQNNDGISTNTESFISDIHNHADNFHYKTADRRYMQAIYHLTEENANISLGEIYYGIIIAFGILLIFAFYLCIKFFYDIISVRLINKHKRLEEEKDNEINKRLNPLKLNFPSTPVDKDLRFNVNVNREKMDMFCDLHSPY